MERRQELRRKTLLTGRIEFFNRSVFDCVVRNLSGRGARISCDQQVALPDIFDLILVKQSERKRVRAIWRGEDVIGLAFLEDDEYSNVLSFTPPAPPSPSMQ